MMKKINHCLELFFNKPQAFVVLLVMAAVLHLGTTINGRMAADDYIHAAMFSGSANLFEKQLTASAAPAEFNAVIDQQFNFFDSEDAAFDAYKNFGALPWWATTETAKLHFFRPLATLTHYLDYKLWPNSARLMQAVNLLWYLLSLSVIYACYKTFQLRRSVALLALMLVILDQSVFQVVSWIAARNALMAMTFGFLTVLAYHHSLQSKIFYVVALLCLLLSLLSAEAGVVVACYLGAYFLVMDERPWLHRTLHLLPFAVLVMVWQVLYQQQGFGSSGVDFYLDPATHPLEFIQLAGIKLWSNFFELWSGIDVFSGQVRADVRQQLAILGVLIFSLLIFLIVTKSNADQLLSKPAKFFLLASIFSLVPGLAVALSPRVMLFPFVGFAVVLAELILITSMQKNNLSKARVYLLAIFNSYSLIIHLLLSFIVAVLVLLNTLSIPENKSSATDVLQNSKSLDSKHVIFMASPQAFNLMFLAYELDYKEEPLPLSIRQLSNQWFNLTVERISETEVLLSSSHVFQLDNETLSLPEIAESSTEKVNKQSYDIHYAYLMQQLLGLVRPHNLVWQQGEITQLPEMNIAIDKLSSVENIQRQRRNKPQTLRIHLTQPLDSYLFFTWNLENKSYEKFVLPEVGESTVITGMFN